jgi:hypothetical protein
VLVKSNEPSGFSLLLRRKASAQGFSRAFASIPLLLSNEYYFSNEKSTVVYLWKLLQMIICNSLLLLLH